MLSDDLHYVRHHGDNLSAIIELLDRQTLLAAFTAAFTVVYVITAQRFLLQSRERRKRREFEQHEAISKGLLNGAIESIDDLINVYKGINGLSADDISYRAGLGKFLREYLAKLVSSDDLGHDQIKELKDKVNSFLKKIDEESPFADLPAAERNLILDVQRFVSVGDNASAFRKLEDLAGLIEVRQDGFEKLQNSNKWSIPLAVIGLVLTVVFGVASLF